MPGSQILLRVHTRNFMVPLKINHNHSEPTLVPRQGGLPHRAGRTWARVMLGEDLDAQSEGDTRPLWQRGGPCSCCEKHQCPKLLAALRDEEPHEPPAQRPRLETSSEEENPAYEPYEEPLLPPVPKALIDLLSSYVDQKHLTNANMRTRIEADAEKFWIGWWTT